MAPVSTAFELDVVTGMEEDLSVGVGVGVGVGVVVPAAEVVALTVVKLSEVLIELVVCTESEVEGCPEPGVGICVTAKLVLVGIPRFVLVGTPGYWLATIGTKSPKAPLSRLKHMTSMPGCVV